MGELQQRAAELTHLNSIMALLQWDQEVMLPRGGSGGRADQISALSTIIHQKITDPELGRILSGWAKIITSTEIT